MTAGNSEEHSNGHMTLSLDSSAGSPERQAGAQCMQQDADFQHGLHQHEPQYEYKGLRSTWNWPSILKVMGAPYFQASS